MRKINEKEKITELVIKYGQESLDNCPADFLNNINIDSYNEKEFSEKFKQYYAKVCNIFTRTEFLLWLKEYKDIVTEIAEKEYLEYLYQETCIQKTVEWGQVVCELEKICQGILWAYLRDYNLEMPVTLEKSGKVFFISLCDVQPYISLETQLTIKLSTILEEWQDQENKSKQDEEAIEELITSGLGSEYFIQTLCKTIYELKYEMYEQISSSSTSKYEVPYEYYFPFLPKFVLSTRLSALVEEMRKDPQRIVYERLQGSKLFHFICSQCIDQLVRLLEKPEYKAHQELIKFHIEEIAYSGWAQRKVFNSFYLNVNFFCL